MFYRQWTKVTNYNKYKLQVRYSWACVYENSFVTITEAQSSVVQHSDTMIFTFWPQILFIIFIYYFLMALGEWTGRAKCLI